MTKKTTCRILNLAESGATRIGYCQDCRIFHVQVGYATLQISYEGFVGLYTATHSALALLERTKAATENERSHAVAELNDVRH